MKQYMKIMAFISAICILSGCSKFLDRQLENQGEAAKVDYTNLGNMYQPVSGVYRTASSGSFNRWIITAMLSERSDDIEPGNDDAGQIGIHNFQTDVTVKSYWAVNDMWINLYNVVLTANSALAELEQFGKNIPASDATNTALLARYKAEVKYFRALAHFYIGRQYGSIPILGLESNDASALASAKKSTIEEVKKYVMAEMDTCIASLEDARPNQAAHLGGVTKYAALMLKAKAAMDLAGNDNNSTYWDVALDATNQIVNSQKFLLFGDYYNLWKNPGKLSDEAILEFQY